MIMKKMKMTMCFRSYLQVEVGDLFGVQVEDAVQDLLEELRGLLLAERLLLGQEVKELAAGHAGRGGETGGINNSDVSSQIRATNPGLSELS